MTEVRALTPADEPAYTAFLAGRPDALLYHSLPYRDLLVEHLGCQAEYLLALDGGEIRGVLPTMTRDGVLNSLPFYGSHGGPVGEPEALLAAWDERAAEARAATLVTNPFGPPHREPLHDATDLRLNQAVPLAGRPARARGAQRGPQPAQGAAARRRGGDRERPAPRAGGDPRREHGPHRRRRQGPGVLHGRPAPLRRLRRLHRAARRRARGGRCCCSARAPPPSTSRPRSPTRTAPRSRSRPSSTGRSPMPRATASPGSTSAART